MTSALSSNFFRALRQHLPVSHRFDNAADELAFSAELFDKRSESRSRVIFISVLYSTIFHFVFRGQGLFWVSVITCIAYALVLRHGSRLWQRRTTAAMLVILPRADSVSSGRAREPSRNWSRCSDQCVGGRR